LLRHGRGGAISRSAWILFSAYALAWLFFPWAARRALKVKLYRGGRFQISRARAGPFTRKQVRYWTEALGCSEDELAAAVARVGNSIDAVRRELNRHRGYGTFRLKRRA
jgi:Protein of unknown function (DUF3606)